MADVTAKAERVRIIATDMENQAIGPVTMAQRYERVHSQNMNGGVVTVSEGELGDGGPSGDLKIPDLMDKPIG